MTEQRATITEMGLFCAAVAALIPLVPVEFRLWNFALFGALGVYLSSRGLFWLGLAFMLISKLLSDFLNYQVHGSNPAYLPMFSVYFALLCYPAFAWLCSRNTTRNPLRILMVTVGAGGLFFLITNFLSWYQQALPYSRDLSGLLQAYEMGLPFHRGTLIADVVGVSLLYLVEPVWGVIRSRRFDRVFSK